MPHKPTPDSETIFTEELDLSQFHAYHQALGEFVSVFSEVEVNLLSALWSLADIKPETARAVLTGIKVEGAIGFINRIADVQQWSEARKQQFKNFSDQLGLINKLRNDILHNGSNWTGLQTWTITNRIFAHIPSRIRSYPVTAELLREARQDLRKIEDALVLFTWGEQMPPAIRLNFERAVQKPWLYKPPPGFEMEQRNPKIPHKQPTQPKASRASRRREAMKKRQK